MLVSQLALGTDVVVKFKIATNRGSEEKSGSRTLIKILPARRESTARVNSMSVQNTHPVFSAVILSRLLVQPMIAPEKSIARRLTDA